MLVKHQLVLFWIIRCFQVEHQIHRTIEQAKWNLIEIRTKITIRSSVVLWPSGIRYAAYLVDGEENIDTQSSSIFGVMLLGGACVGQNWLLYWFTTFIRLSVLVKWILKFWTDQKIFSGTGSFSVASSSSTKIGFWPFDKSTVLLTGERASIRLRVVKTATKYFLTPCVSKSPRIVLAEMCFQILTWWRSSIILSLWANQRAIGEFENFAESTKSFGWSKNSWRTDRRIKRISSIKSSCFIIRFSRKKSKRHNLKDHVPLLAMNFLRIWSYLVPT